VLNADDPICRSFPARTQAQCWEFSTRREVARGAFLRGDDLLLARGDSSAPHVVMSRCDILLPGMHNVGNVLAALAIGGALGLDPGLMADGVRSFRAVPHRIEPVGEVGGVGFFNDSKGTNLNSVEVALASFPAREAPDGSLSPRVVLIAGGRDKGAPWKSLRDLVSRTVKGLVGLGEAGPVVLEAWGGAVGRTCEATGMAEAIRRAREMAEPGDIVLLSPGCASFDLYENYEQRGDHFRSLVQALLEKDGSNPTQA
jgi:UDP-N-acetylmuramoylalanine--D-glutamate ligase